MFDSLSNSAPATLCPLRLYATTCSPNAAIRVASSSTTISTPPSRDGILLCPINVIFMPDTLEKITPTKS